MSSLSMPRRHRRSRETPAWLDRSSRAQGGKPPNVADADTDDFDRYHETAKYRSHHIVAPGEVTVGGMRVLFTVTQIAARVEALAAEITRTIPGEFVIVG